MEPIIASVLAAIVIREVYALLPQISRWLIGVAVRRLPIEERDTYARDWADFVADMPHSIVGLVQAIGFLGAANAISSGYVEAKTIQVRELRNEVVAAHAAHRRGLQGLRVAKGLTNKTHLLETTIRNGVSELRDSYQAASGGAEEMAVREDAIAAYEGFGQNVVRAFRRQSQLLDRTIENGAAILDRRSRRLNELLERHDSFWRSRRAREWRAVEAFLLSAREELQQMMNEFTHFHYDEGDEETFKEYKRLSLEIRRITADNQGSVLSG